MIKLDFDIKRSEILKYYGYIYLGGAKKNNRMSRIRILLAVVFGLLAFLNFITNGFGVEVVLFGLAAVTLPFVVPNWLKKIYLKRIDKMLEKGNSSLLEGRRVMEFEEETVSIKSMLTDSTIRWEAFESFEELDNFYVLKMVMNTGYIIPKRAFENEQQKEALLRLMKDKINPLG